MTRKEAKAAGLTRYVGKICEKHPEAEGERTASRGCVQCQRDHVLASRRTESGKAKMKAYRAIYSQTEVSKAVRKAFAASPAAKAVNVMRARIRLGYISKFATPAWANKTEIGLMYAIAARVSRETGIKHNVDHEIPLKGELVCGLHVPGNFQLLTATVNGLKGNKHA